jgi:hypothetical protein
MAMKLHPDVKRSILNRTRRLRKLSDYIDARNVFNDSEYREYLEWKPPIQKAFPRMTHNHRLILFCFFHLEWPRSEIIRRVCISKRSYYNVLDELRSYDAIVLPVPSRAL